jgi:hypothetical protein
MKFYEKSDKKAACIMVQDGCGACGGCGKIKCCGFNTNSVFIGGV